jgi:hypothetical protein
LPYLSNSVSQKIDVNLRELPIAIRYDCGRKTVESNHGVEESLGRPGTGVGILARYEVAPFRQIVYDDQYHVPLAFSRGRERSGKVRGDRVPPTRRIVQRLMQAIGFVAALFPLTDVARATAVFDVLGQPRRLVLLDEGVSRPRHADVIGDV